MNITTHNINDVLNLKLKDKAEFESLGLINSKYKKNILSFIDNENLITELENNLNIKGIFVPKQISKKIK